VSDAFQPDTSLQVQALSRLIVTDAQKAIPRLKQIVLEHADPSAARGAVFVLAQSRNPEAYRVVVDVALTGPEPLRLVAVRDLGLFGGADASQELLRVYSLANRPVKQSVVIALGQRSDAPSLFKIVTSETDPALRERAIVALGRAGGRDGLRVLYAKAHLEIRQAIVTGLCNARDEVGLIRIADQEKDASVRNDAVVCLKLMGTPGAKAYLAKEKEGAKERK
jgi:HEAT repeat protein